MVSNKIRRKKFMTLLEECIGRKITIQKDLTIKEPDMELVAFDIIKGRQLFKFKEDNAKFEYLLVEDGIIYYIEKKSK